MCFSGAFRGLRQCDLNARCGLVDWSGNWVTFIDNMLQMQILQEDTRFLYVPTGIERLIIDSRAHSKIAEGLGENPALPVYVYKECGTIK